MITKEENFIMRFSHTNIAARDWKKLSDFYINVFECEMGNLAKKQNNVNGIRFGFHRLYAYAGL
jgi:hypothetical protein